MLEIQIADEPLRPGATLEKLERLPDVLLCDGQGLAHPRRFGIACHLGVLTDLPSIGVAKKRLTGTHDDPPDIRGRWVPLMHKEDTIGAVLRTRAGVKPVYVSCGHRVGLETAVELVMALEENFDIEIPDEDAEKIKTVRDAVSYIDEHVKSAN